MVMVTKKRKTGRSPETLSTKCDEMNDVNLTYVAQVFLRDGGLAITIIRGAYNRFVSINGREPAHNNMRAKPLCLHVRAFCLGCASDHSSLHYSISNMTDKPSAYSPAICGNR
jgi:hypothetical protein